MTSSDPPSEPSPAAGSGGWRPPDVVVVGAASRDLAGDDPRGWRLGGAVSYASLTIARLGLRVGALVGADEAGSGAVELDRLREAGVDVRLVHLDSGPVFDNIETPEGRHQIAHATSDLIPPERLPPEWAGAGAWLFGPVAGELPDTWAEVPGSPAIVALGWQGILRTVNAGEPVRRLNPMATPLLARADLVGVSGDDLPPGTGMADLCRFLRPGSTLLMTAGDRGGIIAEVGPDRPRRLHRYPAIPAEHRVDPTGAGDVFLASVLAARTRPGLVGGRIGQHHDLKLAAAVASLLVEAPGLDGVPDREAVRRRLARAGSAGRVG